MLELPHALMGATIATRIGNPILAIPLALISHVLLDLLPHWNPHLYTEMENQKKISKKSLKIILIDCFLALIIGSFFALRLFPDIKNVLLVFICIGFAVVPDLLEAPFYFLGSRHNFFKVMINFHRKFQTNVPVAWGILSQSILVGVCLYLLLTA